ncbi:MAG TPA: biotin/lipoyl-containing protein, partial [Solirubrobacterales bacterium]|nr:biotin/lipoyl-containing protein [Solirubrobacterales bacterium]
APGPIGSSYREPSGPGVRVDSGVEGGFEVTPMYDPMVAKLIVWDVDREKATRRMLRALSEYDSGGLTTLIPFHEAILATEQWDKGETCRDLMEDNDWLKSTAPADASPPEPSEDGGEIVTRDYKVEVSGKLFDVKVIGEAVAGTAAAAPAPGGKKPPKRERKAGGGASSSSEALPAPLQGTVFKVVVEEGAEVAEGDLICVIEAMKMENEITAHRAGKVTSLSIKEGDAVNSGDTLATIE